MVICETAIDMFSLAALEGTQGRRFFSTAGQISPLQAECLRSATARIPEEGTIILAFDNDDGGRELARQVRKSVAGITQQIVDYLPYRAGADWNDVLKKLPSEYRSNRTTQEQASIPSSLPPEL